MGIDFSHCTASWSYSGFSYARERLAQQLGFSLDEMEGFGGDRSWDTVNDPIKPLLNHSDCDGDLSPEECETVAARLREMIASWPDDYDRRQFEELALGMERAAEEGERLLFT